MIDKIVRKAVSEEVEKLAKSFGEQMNDLAKNIHLSLAQNKTPNANKIPLVAILADYENIINAAQEHSFFFSFRKLKEFSRQFGLVESCFCVTFLPNHLANKRTGINLHKAGYKIQLCPPTYVQSEQDPEDIKEKDRVDTHIKEYAECLLKETNVGIIIIVSADADFISLETKAADLRKQAHVISPLALRPEVEAANDNEGENETASGRTTLRAAIKLMNQGKTDTEDETVQFITQVIQGIAKMEKSSRDKTGHGFMKMNSYLLGELKQLRQGVDWSNFERRLNIALSCLKDENVLKSERRDGSRYSYYELDTNHPAVKFALFTAKTA